MPGMKEITPQEANKMQGLVEVKVDGTRMGFDGQDIKSDREIVRNARFPHIVQALRKFDWKVRGEIALPHGNVLQINRKENWSKARFYLFDLFEHKGQDLRGKTPDEIRDRIHHALKGQGSETIVMPRAFDDFGDGWNYAKSQKAKGNYVEGVVLKTLTGKPFKIKLLTEEKLPIIGFEAGAVKGAFIMYRNGVACKVSGTSIDYVKRYHAMTAKGLKPYVEIEYQFLTDEGKPFQPRLRQLGTLKEINNNG